MVVHRDVGHNKLDWPIPVRSSALGRRALDDPVASALQTGQVFPGRGVRRCVFSEVHCIVRAVYGTFDGRVAASSRVHLVGVECTFAYTRAVKVAPSPGFWAEGG
jgi:hypothetical protein